MRTLTNLVKKMIDRRDEWIKNTHSSYTLLLQKSEGTSVLAAEKVLGGLL